MSKARLIDATENWKISLKMRFDRKFCTAPHIDSRKIVQLHSFLILSSDNSRRRGNVFLLLNLFFFSTRFELEIQFDLNPKKKREKEFDLIGLQMKSNFNGRFMSH